MPDKVSQDAILEGKRKRNKQKDKAFFKKKVPGGSSFERLNFN